MRLTIDKLYGEIVVLMTYCATGDIKYLSSAECANRFKNILETIKEYKIIEDELRIDLITLFTALKNGIYGKIGNKIEHILAPQLSWYNQEIYIFKIKDYGKTWALAKEELDLSNLEREKKQ